MNKPTKKCRVVPVGHRFIPGLLEKRKRIDKEMVLDLDIQDIIRCMSNAYVYEILADSDNGEEVLLNPLNFNKKNSASVNFTHDETATVGNGKVGYINVGRIRL